MSDPGPVTEPGRSEGEVPGRPETVYLDDPRDRSERQVPHSIVFDGPERIVAPFRMRHGRLAGSREPVVLQVAPTEEAVRLLSTEVAVGTDLLVDLTTQGYPDQLSRLIGYRLDLRTPYLLRTHRGTPLTELLELQAGRQTGPHGTPAEPSMTEWSRTEPSRRGPLPLTGDRRTDAIRGLLTAVRLLAGTGVVHRALSPDTVLWSESGGIQVTGFGHGRRSGLPRGGPLGEAPWASPEQLRGEGVVDPRDDVYAAALLIFLLSAEGIEVTEGPAAMRDRVLLFPDLRELLAGACADTAHDRPTALDLLDRLGLQDPAPLGLRNLMVERYAAAQRDHRRMRDDQERFLSERRAAEMQAARQRSTRRMTTPAGSSPSTGRGTTPDLKPRESPFPSPSVRIGVILVLLVSVFLALAIGLVGGGR